MDDKSHFALGKTVGRGAIVLSAPRFDSEGSALFGGEAGMGVADARKGC